MVQDSAVQELLDALPQLEEDTLPLIPPIQYKWKRGDIVTCKKPKSAYYFGYYFHPAATLQSGQPARIANVVPSITGKKKYLVIVDFVTGRDDQFNVRRASIHPDNIKYYKEKS